MIGTYYKIQRQLNSTTDFNYYTVYDAIPDLIQATKLMEETKEKLQLSKCRIRLVKVIEERTTLEEYYCS